MKDNNHNPVIGFAVTVWDQIGPNTLFYSGISEVTLISAPARLYTMIGEKGFRDAQELRVYGPIPTDDGIVLMLGRMLADKSSNDTRIVLYGNPIMILLFFQSKMEKNVRKSVPEIQAEIREIFSSVSTIEDLQNDQEQIANAISTFCDSLNEKLAQLAPISSAALVNMPKNSARAARLLVEHLEITVADVTNHFSMTAVEAKSALEWLIKHNYVKYDTQKDKYFILPSK